MILLACLTLTAGVLFYIFALPQDVQRAPEKSRAAFLRERKETIYENLRDLNFEHKAGKVPEADYLSLRSSLEDEVAAVLAEIDTLEPPAGAPATQVKGVQV